MAYAAVIGPPGDGETVQQDQGRFEVSGDEADRRALKTSQLRKVANTGAWYQEGAVC